MLWQKTLYANRVYKWAASGATGATYDCKYESVAASVREPVSECAIWRQALCAATSA
jgi:hypothetical protein